MRTDKEKQSTGETRLELTERSLEQQRVSPMNSGYFLEAVDVSWMCGGVDAGPSGSLPQWLNTSTTGSVRCNVTSPSWPPTVNHTADEDADMPRFSQLSLVKTVAFW